MDLLATNERVKRCWTKQQAEMLLGRALEAGTSGRPAHRAAGGSYEDYVRALLTHDLFRRTEVADESRSSRDLLRTSTVELGGKLARMKLRSSSSLDRSSRRG